MILIFNACLVLFYCYIALGDTGGVPYDILQPVLEKYVLLSET